MAVIIGPWSNKKAGTNWFWIISLVSHSSAEFKIWLHMSNIQILPFFIDLPQPPPLASCFRVTNPMSFILSLILSLNNYLLNVCAMDWMFESSQNLYVNALTPNVTYLKIRPLNVIKVEWGHKSGVLIQ